MPNSIGKKKAQYDLLVTDVQNTYLCHNISREKQPLRLEWCKECKEINLWTYWQGRGHLDAKIMLVGQDWGCPWDISSSAVMDNIRKMNSGRQVPYMNGNSSITDKNLAFLFETIGYKINESSKKNKDLFFTNLVLGYRNVGTSGGFKSSWVTHDEGFFKQLIHIIEPEIILCLGRSTFEGVLRAFHYRLPMHIRNYNQFIASAQNPIFISLNSVKSVKVFALAHCGVLGTMNRNKGTGLRQGLDLQVEDWKKVKNSVLELNR